MGELPWKEVFSPPDYPVIKLTSSSVSEAALFLEFHKVWTDLIDKLLTAGSAHVSLGTDIEIHLAKAHLGYSRLVILLLWNEGPEFIFLSLFIFLVPSWTSVFWLSPSTTFTPLYGFLTFFIWTPCANRVLSDCAHSLIRYSEVLV